jgi:hypothetical protein
MRRIRGGGREGAQYLVLNWHCSELCLALYGRLCSKKTFYVEPCCGNIFGNVARSDSDYGMGWTIWGSNSGGVKRSSSSLKGPHPFWGPRCLLFNAYRGSSTAHFHLVPRLRIRGSRTPFLLYTSSRRRHGRILHSPINVRHLKPL